MAINKVAKRKNKAGLDRTGASDDGGARPITLGQHNVLVDKVNEIIDEVTGSLDAVALTLTGDLTVAGTTTLNGTLVLGDAAADALTVNATTTYSEPVNYANATGISAFATGGQASATALTEELNNVMTVATAGDSVKLPAAVAGKHIWVKNSGAAALDIFPATSDSIDALGVNLAIRIQPGSSIDFYAKDAIVWESSLDNSLTLNSPTTVTGQLELKATASAGNTVTTITNASQAAARTYTIPDAGTSAEFIMAAGAQNIAGIKTFTDTSVSSNKDTGGAVFEGGIGVEKEIYAGLSINAGTYLTSGNGTVALPAIGPFSDPNSGLYVIGADNLGMALNGAKVLDMSTTGLAVTGAVSSTTGLTSSSTTATGVGYTGAAGGSVTQGAGRTTGVTLSKNSGAITTDTASLAAEASAEFTITNTLVAITDIPVIAVRSGTNGGNTLVEVSGVANGSFNIRVYNQNAAGGTAETGAIIINFAIIKGTVG